MATDHIYRADRTIVTLLARITGKPETQRHDLQPTFNEPVPEPNRGYLLSFHRNLITEELSTGRIAVLLGNMYRVSVWLEHQPFDAVTVADIIDLIERIKHVRRIRKAKIMVDRGYAAQTIEGYKMTLKKFWRWLRNPDVPPSQLNDLPYPSEVSWIKRKKKMNAMLPKDIWTPDEVNRLAAATSTLRDKAFVLGLFGSGCRIGEFLPLLRRDVAFDDYGAHLSVTGKTGPRRVRLTPGATTALAAWLELHPNKDTLAPVWIDTHLRAAMPNQPLTYDWAHEMLKHLAKRAGITKPIRPHLLRHSLATHYASQLTEAVMNEHFGWRQGGRTAAVYTHLSGRQVDDQILGVFGMQKQDQKRNTALEAKACPRCALENTPNAETCSRCGFPLVDEAVHTLLKRRKSADAILNELTKSPDFLTMVEKVLRQRAPQEDSGHASTLDPDVHASGRADRSGGGVQSSYPVPGPARTDERRARRR